MEIPPNAYQPHYHAKKEYDEMGLKLHHLECLKAVLDHGGTRKAAAALSRSAAAVSKSMRELESQVGVPLIERSVEGIAPTEAGATLSGHARVVLGQMRLAEEDVMQLSKKTGGTVRMAVTPWLLQSVLPSAVREFRALRPDVKLCISEHLGDEYPDVQSGALDFALGPSPRTSDQSALETRKLFSYSYAVVGRIGHPATEVRQLKELSAYDWVVSRPIERMSSIFGDFLNIARDGKVERFHCVRSLQAALAIVEVTDMLTLVPWPLIETADIREFFATLHLNEQLDGNATCLVTRRFEPMPGAVIGFLDCFFRATREHSNSAEPSKHRIFRMVDAS